MKDQAHISRRDYFAAHAPADIPDWFKVDRDDLPPEPSKPARPAAVEDPEVEKAIDHLAEFVADDPAEWGEQDMSNTGLHPEKWADARRLGVIWFNYRIAVSSYQTARDQWREECARRRYLGWRAWYGKRMAEVMARLEE